MPKMIPKVSTKSTFGRSGSDFWGFGCVFEGSDFRWIFDRQKVSEKSDIWRPKVGKRWPACYFEGGSADRAGSVWGQESAEVRVKIRHALKPRSARRGRRIRMRHAARAPPPPYLELGGWCSWLHSANCKLSIRVLVSAFFICVWLLHISADICMFLMFAVNSLRVRRCWQSASLIAKYLRNALKIMPKSIQIHPKSVPNQPKWCQGEFRKRPCEQVGSTCFPE